MARNSTTLKPGDKLPGRGRRKGSLGKMTKLRDQYANKTGQLIDKMYTLAVAGDVQAAKVYLQYMASPSKAVAPTITLDIPDNATVADKSNAIMDGIFAGIIPPDIGAQLILGLAAHIKAVETDEILNRLNALEENENEQL